MNKIYVGCCGAYCKTCKELKNKICKGCKIGYDTKARDINKAKCKIKLCCFKENSFHTCADCSQLTTCNVIQFFYKKNGHKYKKYCQNIEFIIKNGYNSFFNIAKKWKNAYGKLEQ